MATDRPTFHESWYRVADLRPRLTVGVQSYRQHFRGRRWHVLRDRATGKFYRLSDAAYQFVGLLDGDRTVNEAWLSCQEHLGNLREPNTRVKVLLTVLMTMEDVRLPIGNW